MRTVQRATRIAHAEGKNWKNTMYQFLLTYRTTPHTTTGVAPAQLLFKRTVRNKLPDSYAVIPSPLSDHREKSEPGDYQRIVPDKSNSVTPSNDVGAAMQRDEKRKQKMKDYADKTNHAQQSLLQIGDVVLVKQERTNKLSLPYDIEPYSITRIKGSMVTAVRPGHMITRNSSYFKKIIVPQKHNEEDESTEPNSQNSGGKKSEMSEGKEEARRYPK